MRLLQSLLLLPLHPPLVSLEGCRKSSVVGQVLRERPLPVHSRRLVLPHEAVGVRVVGLGRVVRPPGGDLTHGIEQAARVVQRVQKLNIVKCAWIWGYFLLSINQNYLVTDVGTKVAKVEGCRPRQVEEGREEDAGREGHLVPEVGVEGVDRARGEGQRPVVGVSGPTQAFEILTKSESTETDLDWGKIFLKFNLSIMVN